MHENYEVEPIRKTVFMDQRRSADRLWLSIEGMDCSDCAIRVRNRLISLEGVYAADVYRNMELAEVFYDRHRVSPHTIQQAVHSAGTRDERRYHVVVIATEG